jgi:hypothetical protein
LTTVGVSEIALATRKKCRICGHQLSLHQGQAAATVQPSVDIRTPLPPSPSPSGRSPAEEIAHLAQLRDNGHISQAEFETLKGRVVAGG